MMSDAQLLRYSRQILLPEIDIDGQKRLLSAHVLVVGIGGLGCPAVVYLAAAGVGKMTLVDPDTVDTTNLQRQIAFSQADVGKPKVVAAAERIGAINPDCQIKTIAGQLPEDALFSQIQQCDVVVDATDNFDSRFMINRCAIRAKKPLVSGAAIQWRGQLMVFDHRQSEAPCYRCLYNDDAQSGTSCAESGILGPVVGTIGTMQALEAIKLLVNTGQSLSGKLLLFDAMEMEWQRLALEKDPHCPACNC
jgi:adenylyltransferase/sulfurtransferase